MAASLTLEGVCGGGVDLVVTQFEALQVHAAEELVHDRHQALGTERG